MTAPDLTPEVTRLRLALQGDRSDVMAAAKALVKAELMARPPAREGVLVVPAWVVEYAEQIGQHFAAHNIRDWAVGPVQSRPIRGISND